MKLGKLIKKHKGFTLAEVLITLGIIGVVAAITIPVLMNNVQDNQFKTAYKKAYSIIQQAFQKSLSDNDIVPFINSYGNEANFAVIKQQFSIAKDCDNSHLSDCWDTTGETFRNESSTVPSFIDKSGMAWRLRNPDTLGYLSTILVDTNGFKKPNQYGKDRFPLVFYNSTVPDIDTNSVYGSYSPVVGMPAKIIPISDISVYNTENARACPSLSTRPCYYTSWLYN